MWCQNITPALNFDKVSFSMPWLIQHHGLIEICNHLKHFILEHQILFKFLTEMSFFVKTTDSQKVDPENIIWPGFWKKKISWFLFNSNCQLTFCSRQNCGICCNCFCNWQIACRKWAFNFKHPCFIVKTYLAIQPEKESWD